MSKTGNVVGDYVQLQRGTTYKSCLLGQPGPVLLGLGSIGRNGGFRDDSLKTYGGPSDPKLLLTPGDIYVSLKDVTQSADLLGAVARVPDHVPVGRLTQDTVKLLFRTGAPKEYLYWLLRTPQYREYCRAHSTGTTNLGLAREDFFAFPVPELSTTREAIVSLLESIERKIELNRRMNEALEAMARAIFRDWFVDFGPTRAKMAGVAPYLAADLWALFPDRLDDAGNPEGWRGGTLGQVAVAKADQVSPSSLCPQTPYIGLEHMPRRSIALSDWEGAGKVTSGKISFEAGDLLFGKLRPYFHKVGVAPIDGICSSDIVVVRPLTAESAAFTLMCISDEDFVNFTDRTSTGTKMPRTSWRQMSSYEIVLAPEPLMKAFEGLAGAMVARLRANVLESQTVAEIRDLLLAKLMSGEMCLKGAQRELEAA